MILALLGALVIGVTLGLLGSGGSVVTVPVLLFILQRPEKLAIAESLVIVGATALIGAIPYMYRSQVNWSTVLFFGLPGLLGACLGGCGPYFINGGTQLTLFGFMTLIIGILMLFNQSLFDKVKVVHPSNGLIIVEGFLIGCLTGFLGIGGGFLIVPSLMILCNLSMSPAIGTSLVIISLNSFTGFFNQLYFLTALHLSVDWKVIIFISITSVLGCLSGGFLSQYIPQSYLRNAFGVAILLLGSYILLKIFFNYFNYN